MITAQEAFLAVRDRRTINPDIHEDGFLGMVCKCMVNHINRGWLGINIQNKISGSISELNSMKVYLESLGYIVDSTYSIYWMYNPIIYSRDNGNSQ